MKRAVLVVAVMMALASSAQAESIKGFISEASASSIVVEGQTFRLGPETKIERQNHKDITVKDLRIGWDVEVDSRTDGSVRKVKVKNARFQQEDIEGVVDGINHVRFFVDGDEIRLKKGAVPEDLKPGMRFKGKGIRQDDRSIILDDGKMLPAGFDAEEAQFMSAAAQEITEVQKQLKKVDDPELQAYVNRVGNSLVPKWVDPKQYHFTFTLVDDPTLNAFAMPDGTVVVHSGLIAALENEAQLAAVLGHEIAHTTHRHGYRGYKDQQKKKMWAGIGSALVGVLVGSKADTPLVGLATGLGTNFALQAAVNGHGRKLEDEADELGLYYMVEAGYDYMEAPEVWRVFGQYTKDQNKVANYFFSDHSTHAARINNLTKAINEDYRAQISRNALRTGEDEHTKAVEQLKQRTAVANIEQKEYAQAAKSLAAAIDSNPNDAKAHYNLGRVLWAQGGVENARQVLESFGNAIEADPKFAEPWRDAGLVLYELRDTNRAAQALEQYLQLAPDAPEGPKIRAFLSQVKAQPLVP